MGLWERAKIAFGKELEALLAKGIAKLVAIAFWPLGDKYFNNGQKTKRAGHGIR